jgi:flagella basal body P-ring formation protein FlgA
MLAGPASADSCVRVVRALAASTATVAADFEQAKCDAAPAQSAFQYDIDSGITRTRRALSPGEIVPEPPAFALYAVRPGDKLLIRAQSGPVVVEREVEALQAAQPGQKLFVKATDGKVFSVHLAGARP